MHLKYYLKLTLTIILIPLFLILVFSFAVKNITNNSENKIEANRLTKIIDQHNIINVEGCNLKLNASDFLTTKTIDNDLNIAPYEEKYLSFIGFLKTNSKSEVKILIDVNGYSEVINKDMFYFSGNNSNDLNKNINYINYFNNTYYLATTKGLYSSSDGIDFKVIIKNYDITKIYCNDDKTILFLLTNDQKILEYNLINFKLIKLNIDLKIKDLLLNSNFIYISTDDGLYFYNDITKQLKILVNDRINDLEKYNTNIYFSSIHGLYKINDNNDISIIYNKSNVDQFILTKMDTFYWISDNQLFYYYNNFLKKIIIIDNSIQLENLFNSNNNYLFISTNNGLYYLKNNKIQIIKYFNEDNISLFQNITDTFYIYSKSSLVGITFFQMN